MSQLHQNGAVCQDFLSPQSDPSTVAMLVTLGFPLLPSGHAVRLADVGRSAAGSPEVQTAWTVGRRNAAGQDAAGALAAWQLPVADGRLAVLNAAAVCKLALHNRRVLLLHLRQQMPLFSAAWPNYGRLGNWAFDGAHEVAELPAVPPGLCFDTMTAAVAATVGLQLGGWVRLSGQVGWLILPGHESCRYSPAQVAAAVHDAEYLRQHDDALALAAAVLHNRAALLKRSESAGGLNVLRHHSRYAVISTAADYATQLAAARHLNI